MRKISSNYLFYKGLVGFVIGPFLVVLFVRYIMINNVPDFLKDFIYFLLLVVIVTQGRLIYKTRQVFYNSKKMLLKNYFTKQSDELQLEDIVSIKKAFSLQRERNRNLYKLIYTKENKNYSIYFFIILELASVDNLEVFIGLDKIKHTDTTLT
jgi:hypothetical protein